LLGISARGSDAAEPSQLEWATGQCISCMVKRGLIEWAAQ